jgi:hypothetical protein
MKNARQCHARRLGHPQRRENEIRREPLVYRHGTPGTPAANAIPNTVSQWHYTGAHAPQ